MESKRFQNPAWSEPTLMPHFDPLGVHPHDIPTPGIFDEPVVQVCINTKWASHITGMIERLLYDDAWRGTNEQVYAAQEAIRQVIAQLDTIKGRCSMSDCCFDNPPLTRILPDGTFQSSTDGGQTWIDDPARDPRNQITQLPPPPGDFGTQKCKGANNVVAYLELSQAQMESQLNTDSSLAAVTAIITGILLILGIITLGATAVIAAALTVIVAGLSAQEFAAEFTEAKWQAMTELIYCNMDDFGQLKKPSNLYASNIVTETGVIFGEGSIGGRWIIGLLNAVGPNGINNAAAIPSANSRSCDAAQCTHWWQFDLRNPDVSAWLIAKTGTQGHYEAGTGWVADFSSSNNQRICDHWKINFQKSINIDKLQFGHVSANSNFAAIAFQGTEGTNSNQSLAGLTDTPGGFTTTFTWSDCFSGCTDPTDHVPELSFGCHFSGANPQSQTHILTVVRVSSTVKISFPVGEGINDETDPYPVYP